jgi:hypothetical protein
MRPGADSERRLLSAGRYEAFLSSDGGVDDPAIATNLKNFDANFYTGFMNEKDYNGYGAS